MHLHDPRDPREHEEDTSAMASPDAETKVCIYCGRRFPTEDPDSEYCSMNCVIDAERDE